jgi:hypothetical protein
MKRIAVALVALIVMERVAWAACPPGSRYRCNYVNGKSVCGCY